MVKKRKSWQQNFTLVSRIRHVTSVIANVSVPRQYLGLMLQTTNDWKTMVKSLIEIVRNAQSQVRALGTDRITAEITPIESKCFYDCIQLIDSVLPKLPVNGCL